MKYLLLVLLSMGLGIVVACGDDDSTDGDDDDDDNGQDTGTGEPSEPAGLAACADFQVIVWDLMRECDDPKAVLLPDNSQIGTICEAMCETIDTPIPQGDVDACLEFAENISCEDLDIQVDGGSFLPEECAYLENELGCDFTF